MVDSEVARDEDGNEYVVEDLKNDPAVIELAKLKQKKRKYCLIIAGFSALTVAAIVTFLVYLLVKKDELGYTISGIIAGLFVVFEILVLIGYGFSIKDKNKEIAALEAGDISISKQTQ